MWWAVLLVGLFLVGGGLGWAYIPEHRHPFPHFAQSTGRFDGTVVAGIGLVLGRQIAEAHGGTLTLEPRPGSRGARATVTLPI